MRILGIDPGIARVGWGIIDHKGSTVTAVSYDCIETKATLDTPLRLLQIYEAITRIVTVNKPEVLVVEELFFNTNAKTAFIVGQARGIILLAGAVSGMRIAVYTPLQVKMALTGYGRAEKAQIGKMVQSVLRLKTIPKPDDTADALAVALTHAFSRKLAMSTRML